MTTVRFYLGSEQVLSTQGGGQDVVKKWWSLRLLLRLRLCEGGRSEYYSSWPQLDTPRPPPPPPGPNWTHHILPLGADLGVHLGDQFRCQVLDQNWIRKWTQNATKIEPSILISLKETLRKHVLWGTFRIPFRDNFRYRFRGQN